MKKTLMLSALALTIAGTVTGCANCNKCGGCDEVMEVDAMEIITCPACQQKLKCKKTHQHTKDCQSAAQCKTQSADCSECDGKEKDHSTVKNETANCGECGQEKKDGQVEQPHTTASRIN